MPRAALVVGLVSAPWQGQHSHGERCTEDLRGGPVEAYDEPAATAGADGLHELQVRGQQHRSGRQLVEFDAVDDDGSVASSARSLFGLHHTR